MNTAYVLSEANVSTELREGKEVCHLPLYLTPFVAEQYAAEGLDADGELARLGASPDELTIAPPDLSDWG